MQAFIDSLAAGEFGSVKWVFLVFVVAHELEEWNINGFERRHFSDVPAFATNRSARGFIFLISLAALGLTAAAAYAGDGAAPWIFLPAVFFMLSNACQHLYWSIRFRTYAPGVVTALALIVPLGLYLIGRSVTDEGVSPVYPAVMAVVSILVWVQTVRAGDRMTGSVVGAYAAGNWITRRLPG